MIRYSPVFNLVCKQLVKPFFRNVDDTGLMHLQQTTFGNIVAGGIAHNGLELKSH